MEWERGENPPGRVMATLKTGGMRDLLEQLVAEAEPDGELASAEESTPSAEAWKPLV